MLLHLYIKDLAIVCNAEINFSQGMTVITGETGAGKSILLDALALALGERSDSHLVRPGCDKTEIAVTFDISKLPSAILWLSDLELTNDPPSQCIIRRVLYATGRSKAFINGRPVTTLQLRLLGEYLVQIHGQHQHQLLLKPSEQLRLLDAFGQHDVLLSQVKTTFKNWEDLQRRLTHLQSATYEQSQMALLQYQIEELESLNLGENELENLFQEHDKLAHAQHYIQTAQSALDLLESDEKTNAQSVMVLAQQRLNQISTNQSLKSAKECLETALIQLQEAIHEINHFVEQLELNPARLNEVEQRLERIHDIARKHKIEATHLFEHFGQLQARANEYLNQASVIEQLKQDIELAKTHYQRFSNQLTKAREQSAVKLAKSVSERIQGLSMPGAVFTVELVPHTDKSPHLMGNEGVLFGISANPGHPPQPLSKVASGGELSRISLALELITSEFLATPCLVFDEVDVGISGKTGSMIGKALHNLSKSAQVLCVTHLPQVAAFGDTHIQVIKNRQENSTQSEIKKLTKAERVEEIARLLGGIDVTTQARAAAKALLRQETPETI